MKGRLRSGIIAGLAVLLAGLPSDAAAQSEPLFREIDLGQHGKIVLGEAFAQADQIAEALDDSTFVLKPGTFGGAASIIVRTDARGSVTALFFEYGNTLQFEDVLATSTKNLGAPTGRTVAHWPTDRIEIVYWQDGATRLELKRITSASGLSLSSAMVDLKSKT